LIRFSQESPPKLFTQTTGNVSPLTETRVYKAKPGNRPPDPFSLIFTEDGSAVLSAFLKLDWTDAGDPDGDRLTYTVVLSENDAFFGNPVLREGLSQSACLITPFDTVRDSEHYYWKVRAVDRYGAVRETGVREFHVRNTSPVLTWIGGHVYDASTNRPVTGALVRIGSTVTGDFDPLITLNTDQSGYYLSDLPSHADTVRIEADGYRPVSWLTGNTFDDILSRRADKSEDMVVKKDFGISLTGDMMTDGRVDLKDAVLALQVLTGLPVSLVSADAALDQQKVGLADVVHVLQKITGLK